MAAPLGLPTETNRPRARGAAAALALAIFALYSLYSWFQWRHYITPSWDLGIFSQLAKAYANFETPIVPIKGEGYNLLGDHFHPITLLVTPFYMMWPSPATLLYLQNGLLALSVYLLARYATRLLGLPLALVLAAAYALSFGVQQAISVQFHEVAFALPLLVLSLGNLALTRISSNPAALVRLACYWAAPLAFVKEDMGITVLAIGLVALLRTGWLRTGADLLFPSAASNPPAPARRIRAALSSWIHTPAVAEASLLMAWGLVWSLLAVAVILPFFNTGGVFDYSDRLDVRAALADPLGALAQLFYPWQKSATLGLLLLAGALAWTTSPLALVAAPTLIWRLLSPQEGYWEPTWHYSLTLMPVVFIALLDAAARPVKTPNRSATPRAALARAYQHYRTQAPRILPILALLISLALTPNQPLSQLANPSFATARLSASDTAKAHIINSIPNGSTVAADLSVLTYLVPNHTVYWIGHSGKPAPDYVIIDTLGSAWGGKAPADPAAYATERYGTPYTILTTEGSITVAHRTP